MYLKRLLFGFLIFWLGIGALLAMVISFFTDNLIIQTSIFVISSGLLIFFTKPFVNKFTDHKNSVTTNAYAIVGKRGVVIKEIDPIQGVGQVKISGEVWSAKTENEDKIATGTEVEVIKVDGVKTVVKQLL